MTYSLEVPAKSVSIVDRKCIEISIYLVGPASASLLQLDQCPLLCSIVAGVTAHGSGLSIRSHGYECEGGCRVHFGSGRELVVERSGLVGVIDRGHGPSTLSG